MHDITSYLVPSARVLPSNAEYISHLTLEQPGVPLIRLAANENTDQPSRSVREALVKSFTNVNLYPSPIHPLRAELASRHGVGPESLLLGAGATELVDATLRCFVGPGDRAIVPTPSWQVYERRLLAIGSSPHLVSLPNSQRTYFYDVDAILTAVDDNTKLIVVCSPNNPTGNLISGPQIRRLIDTGLPLLVDRAYSDFAPEDDVHGLAQEYENIIYVKTFSKSYALAGIRLGYLIATPNVVDYIDRFMVPGSSVSSVALDVGLAALRDTQHQQAQIRRITTERERITGSIRDLGLTAYDSYGNFVAFRPLSELTAHDLAAQLLSHGIVVRAVEERLLRTTVGRHEENTAFLNALAAIVSP